MWLDLLFRGDRKTLRWWIDGTCDNTARCPQKENIMRSKTLVFVTAILLTPVSLALGQGGGGGGSSGGSSGSSGSSTGSSGSTTGAPGSSTGTSQNSVPSGTGP